MTRIMRFCWTTSLGLTIITKFLLSLIASRPLTVCSRCLSLCLGLSASLAWPQESNSVLKEEIRTLFVCLFVSLSLQRSAPAHLHLPYQPPLLLARATRARTGCTGVQLYTERQHLRLPQPLVLKSRTCSRPDDVPSVRPTPTCCLVVCWFTRITDLTPSAHDRRDRHWIALVELVGAARAETERNDWNVSSRRGGEAHEAGSVVFSSRQHSGGRWRWRASGWGLRWRRSRRSTTSGWTWANSR